MADDYIRDDFDDFDDFGNFDDYDESGIRPRRRVIRKLFIMIALGGMVGTGAYIYTDGDKIDTAEIPSLIRNAESSLKIRPADSGGMPVPHRDKSIYQRLMGERRAKSAESRDHLSQPLEQPIVRDRAAAPRRNTHDQTPAASIDAPILPADSGPKDENSGHKFAATDPTAAQPEMPNSEPAHAEITGRGTTHTEKSVVSTTDLSDEIRVQLASLRTDGAVKRAWTRMQRSFPDLLGDLALSVVRYDLGAERGVFYRMQVGPMEDTDSARDLCGKLREKKRECLVVKP